MGRNNLERAVDKTVSKTIWRVEWLVHKYNGPPQKLEFYKEDKAMEWAEGLYRAGGERAEVSVTELIVGRIIKFNTDAPLFQK